MKKLFLISTTIIALTAFNANAESCKFPKIASVKVNGLVCDFCARTLEKVFSTKPEVSGIKVDLDKGTVDVNFNPDKKISDEEVTKLITDSGYSVTAINKICK